MDIPAKYANGTDQQDYNTRGCASKCKCQFNNSNVTNSFSSNPNNLWHKLRFVYHRLTDRHHMQFKILLWNPIFTNHCADFIWTTVLEGAEIVTKRICLFWRANKWKMSLQFLVLFVSKRPMELLIY